MISAGTSVERWIRAIVRRPVAVAAVMVALVGLSGLASRDIPVQLLPDVTQATIRVVTRMDGGAADEIDRAVGQPLDRSLRAMGRVSRVTTESRDGYSESVAFFDRGMDVQAAWLDVREAVERVRPLLPEEAEQPVILEGTSARRGLQTLAVVWRDSSVPDPSSIAALRDELEAVPGVARVACLGVREREVVVELRPWDLERYRVTIGRVRDALVAATVEGASGTIARGQLRIPVRVSSSIDGAADVAALTLGRTGDSIPPLRVGDVATVRSGIRPTDGLVRLNGMPAVVLEAFADDDANAFAVARRLDSAVVALQPQFPNARIVRIEDRAETLSAATSGLWQDVVIGAALAVVLLLCFMPDRRDALVIALVVPASLALTLLCFRVFGLTINLLTLGGLALGAGMMTDAAIVAVASIAQERAVGYHGADAAARGVGRVILPIVGATFTTLVVFAPGAFVPGIAGTLLTDVALATTCALASSVLASTVLVPVLAAHLGPWRRGAKEAPGRLHRRINAGLERWLTIHERIIHAGIAHPRAACTAMALVGACTVVGLAQLPRTLLPPLATGYVRVRLVGQPDASPSTMADASAVVERMLVLDPDVQLVLARVGLTDPEAIEASAGSIRESRLLLRLRNEANDTEVAERLRRRLEGVLDISVEVSTGPEGSIATLLGIDEPAFAIALRAQDQEVARRTALMLEQQLHESRAFASVAAPTLGVGRMLTVHVDPERAGLEAASREGVALALRTVTRGVIAGAIARGEQSVPIVLRMGAIASGRAPQLPVGDPIAAGMPSVKESVRPAVVRRHDGRVVQLVTAEAGRDPGAARRVAGRLSRGLGSGVSVELGGGDARMQHLIGYFALSLAAAVLLMYAVLAIEFNSLVLPLLVLVSIPLGMVGAVCTMWLAGVSLNAISLVGLLMLLGIVDNDAVVKLDAIVRARAAGDDVPEALARASRERLRPIVINSLTAMLAVLPVALGIGLGAQLQSPLALVLIGGLASSTLLAPAAVCVLYGLLHRKQSDLRSMTVSDASRPQPAGGRRAPSALRTSA